HCATAPRCDGLHPIVSTIDDLPPLDSATLWTAIESAAEQAKIGVFISHVDVDPPRILSVTQRAADIAARPRDALIGRLPWSMLSDESQAAVGALVERAGDGPPSTQELVVERPDGRRVPIVLASTRIHTAVGMLSFGCLRDITAEREMLADLRG